MSKLKFILYPTTGERANTQRMMGYRMRRESKRLEPDLVEHRIELYSPRIPKQPRRLAPEIMGNLLAAFAYGLIATAIFVSWSNP